MHTVRTRQDSQEEEWSIPSNVGRRENDTERHESPRAPPAPPPSEDRLFADWSSIDSPRERKSPPDASARDTVPNISQPDTQTVQPGSEPAKIEVTGNTPSDVMTFPSTCQQLNQVGIRLIDRETSMSDIEVRTQREETRINNSSSDEVIVPNSRDVQMPESCSNISSYNTEMTGGSHTRTCSTEMIPQLDGPMSVCSRRRISENERTEQESLWRTAVSHRREYPDESSNDSHSAQKFMMIGDPLKGDTKKGVEDHQMEEIIMIEDILEEEDPLMVEDPLMMEDPLDDGGPPGNG